MCFPRPSGRGVVFEKWGVWQQAVLPLPLLLEELATMVPLVKSPLVLIHSSQALTTLSSVPALGLRCGTWLRQQVSRAAPSRFPWGMGFTVPYVFFFQPKGSRDRVLHWV